MRLLLPAYCEILFRRQVVQLLILIIQSAGSEEIDWSVPNPNLYQKCTHYIQLYPSIPTLSSVPEFSTTAVSSAESVSNASISESLTTVSLTESVSNVSNLTTQSPVTAPSEFSIYNISSTEMDLNDTSTTVFSTVTPTPKIDYCKTFEVTYDQMLPSGCIVLKEYRRNSDLTEKHCRERCLRLPACRAFQYSTERDPNCKVFAYRSDDIPSNCQRIQSFDWKLFELKRGCRDHKCGRFYQLRRTVFSGCQNEGGGFINPTQAQCELTCSENHWCLAYIFKAGRSGTSCQLYYETPETSPLCTAVPDRSPRRSSKLLIKSCLKKS